MSTDSKPKLLWLRFLHPKLPSFVQLHMREQELCMSQFFDVTVINERSCDYQQLCDRHEPDLAIFETGVYTVQAEVTNVGYSAQIPKLGFIHCDAYCPTRKTAIANMAKWDISTYFGISVSMAEYTPSIADAMFVWPNFANQDVYRDYGLPKIVPVLFSGSQALHYPWRSRIDRVVSRHYPTLHSPHFGWCWTKKKPPTAGFLQGQSYARLINSAYVAPTCGTIANEVVRKHFEIPACNTCLLTEKTAGLEAAGFEDMVNCVYSSENDVLVKLEWLFENPEELQRITAQGKALVDARHTIRHRNQVYDWFTLHQQLKAGQRVVQPGPFEPMRIAEARSGETHRHVVANAVDRALLTAGDQRLGEGDYAGAERLYRGGLNYHQPAIPDHKFCLIRCQLHQGQAREALATLREHFPSHLSTSKHGFEPDPTEWAWFLITLLCRGKRREAALRAAQFPLVRNLELDRARLAVAGVCKRAPGIPLKSDARAERPSVHRTPCSSTEEWMTSLRIMLAACGQHALVDLLPRTNSLAPATALLPAPGQLCQAQPRGPAPAESQNRLGLTGAVLRFSLDAGSRLIRRRRKVKERFQRLMRQAQRALHVPAPAPFDNNASEVVRLLSREDIRYGVLIGAAQDSWLSDAFMRAMTASPQTPFIICLNRQIAQFTNFHRHYADASDVEFRYLPARGKAIVRPQEASGLIVIEQPELLDDPVRSCAAAQLVVVRQIVTGAGRACYHSLTAAETHDLVLHEPASSEGYAIFRRTTAVRCTSATPLQDAA